MSEKKRIPLLLDEQPIAVYPTLAKLLKNVNKAIMLQQLHFLLNVTKIANNQYNFVNGKWWVYNSYEQWHGYFPWISVSTIKALFGMMERDGLILSMQGVKDRWDRRKWYTIDYEAFQKLVQSMGQKLSDVHETDSIPSEGQKLSDDNRNTENTTENTTEKNGGAKKPRRIDPHFDVIAEVWGTNAGGYVSNLQGMMFGDKKVKGDWLSCQFDPPATIEEVRAFGVVAKRNPVNSGKMPTVPSTIQRQFYEMRVAQAKKIIQYPEGYIPVEERTSVLDSVRVV